VLTFFYTYFVHYIVYTTPVVVGYQRVNIYSILLGYQSSSTRQSHGHLVTVVSRHMVKSSHSQLVTTPLYTTVNSSHVLGDFRV